MKLFYKNAVVTGGSRGIGKGIALSMANEGANVVVLYRRNHEQAKLAVSEIQALGRNAFAICTDVRDKDSVSRAIRESIELLGSIDIFVNNAGITRDSKLENMNESEWNDVISSNLSSVYNCSKEVVTHMISREKGKIINITSLSGLVGNIGQTNYCASKAAVIGFTKSLAAEIGKKGIHVNGIAPGAIETDMLDMVPEKIIMKMKSRVPMSRLGTPKDVGNLAVFLASEDSDYICGQTLIVDGGLGISIL